MRRKWTVLPVLVVIALIQDAIAASVGEQLQYASVTIVTADGSGSGSVVLRTSADGDEMALILTAAHVEAGLRQTNEPEAHDDTTSSVTYADASIVQEQIAGGLVIGELKLKAKVVTVSIKRDIALLLVEARGILRSGVSFAKPNTIPAVGSPVYHCGSPRGARNGGSLTCGIISYVGRRISSIDGEERIYDQSDVAAREGCSGGAVVMQDTGEYIGMITLMMDGGDSFCCLTPIRIIHNWATEIKSEWVLDPKIKAPPREAILKLPIESTPPEMSPRAAGPKSLGIFVRPIGK